MGDAAALFADPSAWATFSDDRAYRYTLGRRWGPGGRVLWVMLNPSTADEHVLDPTIRRCVGFSASWNAGSLEVVNLFALRSTDPAKLVDHPDPVGGWKNQHAIATASQEADFIVCAWGAHKMAAGEVVDDALAAINRPVFCLGTTRAGAPRHPLYVRADQPLTVWAP